jgi:hypothetical protein
MTYSHFASWIEKSQALAGFNLTERLLQQLFADLDPHKKGYLTFFDWENSFGGYNFHDQIFAEVQEAFNANYSDIGSTFELFMSHETNTNQTKREISHEGFMKGIQSLIPKRFDREEVEALWKRCSLGSDKLDLNKFKNVFDNKKFTGIKYVSTNSK